MSVALTELSGTLNENLDLLCIMSELMFFLFFYSAERLRYGTDVMARNRFTDGLVLSLIIFVR